MSHEVFDAIQIEIRASFFKYNFYNVKIAFF